VTARLAGVVAGPLFVGIALAQMLTRPGFDPLRHPVSLLANGAGGWIQVVNFIVTGLLVLAFAVAVRRQLAAGAARAWAPILLATCGMGLVIGGLFRADPALGFPIGTPDEVPATMSVPGAIHAAAPPWRSRRSSPPSPCWPHGCGGTGNARPPSSRGSSPSSRSP
jgi:hypothetical protein